MSKFLSLSIGLLLSLFSQVTCAEPELSAKIVYQLLSMRIDNVVRENNNLKSELQETKAVVGRLENKVESMEVNISLMARKAARYEEENSKTLLNEKMQSFEKLFASRLQKKFKTEAIVSRKMLTNGKSHMKEKIREIEQKFKSFKSELIDNLSAMNTTVDSLENSISKQNITTITMLVAVEDKLKSQLNETDMLIQDMKVDFESKLRSISSKQDRLEDTFSGQISALSQRTSEQNITAITMLVAVEDKLKSQLHETDLLIQDMNIDFESKLRSVSSKQDRQENTFSGQISALRSQISVEEARKVAFSARLRKKQSYYGKDETIVFDTVLYSYGGRYSSSTGIFTAPKSGTYLFTYNIESTSSGVVHVLLMIDGSGTTRALVEKGRYHNGGNSGIGYVWKGEKVWLQTASLQDKYYIGLYRTTFNGILID